jgi:hypothetical protein
MATLLHLHAFGVGREKGVVVGRIDADERFDGAEGFTMPSVFLLAHLVLQKAVRTDHIPHYYNINSL